MNNSTIDVLLQIPVPRVEPAPASARSRDESSAFDNHFRKASNPESPPPAAAQPSKNSNDTRRENTSRKPAAQSDHSSQSSATSSTKLGSATSDEQPETTDAEHDESADTDEAAVAATAVSAQSVTAATPSELVVGATDPSAETTDANAAANAGDDNRARAKEAKLAARANPVAVDNAPATASDQVEEASVVTDVTSKQHHGKQPASSVEDVADSTANPAGTTPAAAEATGDTDAPHSRTRRDDKSQDHAASSTPIAKQEVAASASAVEKAAAAKKSTGEPTGDTASRKADKKANPRSTATPTDASAPPTERSAASAANATSADAPAAATAAAPSQFPAANVASSTTAGAAAKPQDAQPTSKQGFLSPFARLERGAQSARGTNPSGATDGPRHVDPARFVSRVARAIHTAQERGGPLQLRLSPPELGAMRLELSMSQGALTATIETESNSTRQLLIDNLPALRDRLAEQNIKIERFDVDVRRDPSGNGENAAPQDRGQAEHHDRRADRNSPPRTSSAAPAIEEPAPVRRTISNTSINVVA